jgi:glycosyltransferase involved in cell wall biosynthesis
MVEPELAMDIDIIIPTYNRDATIGRAIKSCRTAHVIVVDDGSTDKTAQVVSKYPNVEYIKIEHTGINGKVKDIGIQYGHSKYYAIVDSDDYLANNAIERLEKFVKNQALVYTNHLVDGRHGFNTRIPLNADTMGRDCPIRQLAVVRRDAYELVGGYNTTMVAATDSDLYLRLYSEYGRECVHMNEFLYYKDNTRKDRVSVEHKSIQRQLYIENLRKYREGTL